MKNKIPKSIANGTPDKCPVCNKKCAVVVEEIDGILWFTPTSQLESARNIVSVTGYERNKLKTK